MRTSQSLLIGLQFILAGALAFSIQPTQAQQASQPSFDPTQLERRFEAQQQKQRSEQPVPATRFEAAAGGGSSNSILVRQVIIEGATAIPSGELAFAYKDILGRKIASNDLAAVVNAISERYREAGYHLSRAVIPPQDVANGVLRVKVIEGSLKELVVSGDDADQFGIRAMLAPALMERPSVLKTLERQLLLASGRPGVRIEDTSLEEIGSATGEFRLILKVKVWHVFASIGIDNLGSSSVGPWQSYGTAAFNSYLTPGDSWARQHPVIHASSDLVGSAMSCPWVSTVLVLAHQDTTVRFGRAISAGRSATT